MDAAAADLDFLHSLPLPPCDKKGILQLIQSCLRGPAALSSRLIAATGDISIWRLEEQRRHGLYRVSGLGQCEAEPEVVFELMCNTEIMQEWDVLNKGVRFLSLASDPSGVCSMACLHLVYGLPGVPTGLVADRDFIVRAVKLTFPSGMRLLFCRSITPGEEGPGQPAPRPHVIRGQMWGSGFVVVPLSGGGSCLSIGLLVDPKGWIPTAVVNLSLEAMPLSIHRIRALLARLTPAQIAQLQRQAGRKGNASASGYSGGGREQAARASGREDDDEWFEA